MTDTDPDTSGSADAAAAARLGAAIRALRRVRGLTLVRLAEATDLSHPFLSKIERGLAQPSLGSLRRIALALETSPIELIAAGDETDAAARVEIHRIADPEPMADFARTPTRMLASGDRPFHPMRLESRQRRPGAYVRHREDEFLYVLAGDVRVDLDGEVHALGAGDSVYFRGGVAHRWWSGDGRTIRMLVVKQGAGATGGAQTASTAPRAL